MSESDGRGRSWQSGETHEVLNQSPLFEDIGLYATDRALMEAVERVAFHPAYHELMALSFREGLPRAGTIWQPAALRRRGCRWRAGRGST